ncbi:DUF4381 domain-containing protein [Falsiphaeobacter marinintestinus]|uniref:DUF4381 domain-containing protein n=1 Tax=Falsiphaeobacter marinintestinus TaxID=1492905 RepID=UPI0011B467DE|nr:DUF4381 domain-containing protein [Phaeobacter marinintestinus]
MTEAELQGKNLIELLELLEEVPVPAPVSMVPQTPGWIVLGIVLLTISIVVYRRVRNHRRAEAYRKAALAELGQTADDPARIADVLRRTALAAFPREQVAGLYGQDWLTFLDQSFPGSGFASGPGQVLTTAAYRDTAPSSDLGKLARDWIKTHKRSEGV